MNITFRTLYANEIDCRVKQTSKDGKKVMVLLYKDARVDQNLLDEVVGPMNWQRSHSRDNANCTVSIWDDDKRMWVSKEDTGTESNTEKEKGLASDSFKRACFNWGIGRELYTAPMIWIALQPGEIYPRFNVKSINYDDKNNITSLVIVDERGNERYTYGAQPTATPAAPKPSPAPDPSVPIEPNNDVLSGMQTTTAPAAPMEELKDEKTLRDIAAKIKARRSVKGLGDLWKESAELCRYSNVVRLFTARKHELLNNTQNNN